MEVSCAVRQLYLTLGVWSLITNCTFDWSAPRHKATSYTQHRTSVDSAAAHKKDSVDNRQVYCWLRVSCLRMETNNYGLLTNCVACEGDEWVRRRSQQSLSHGAPPSTDLTHWGLSLTERSDHSSARDITHKLDPLFYL